MSFRTLLDTSRLAVLVSSALVALALPAAAAPVVYNFTSGSATITADTAVSGTSIVGPIDVDLGGSFIEFDDITIEVVDLLIVVDPTAIIMMNATYGGYNQFTIDAASIMPGPGFTTVFGSMTGPGEFDFAAFPLDIDGDYTASHTGGLPLPTSASVPFTDDSVISGTINLGAMTLVMEGITLAVLPGAAFGEAEDLIVKADITFSGIVPEPGTASLLGFGLLGIAAHRRRR